MLISDWSSDVCSSDLGQQGREAAPIPKSRLSSDCSLQLESMKVESLVIVDQHATVNTFPGLVHTARHTMGVGFTRSRCANRSEEHTSELQSLMRISYAVFCLKKKKRKLHSYKTTHTYSQSSVTRTTTL